MLDDLSIGQGQGKGGTLQSSPVTSHGNGHFGAEFLRLHEGAAGERLAGNASWKSEIVLDAGARTCLSAEGACIERDHSETFRGGIDRGGKSGGSGADDRNVIDSIRVVASDHAEAAREL